MNPSERSKALRRELGGCFFRDNMPAPAVSVVCMLLPTGVNLVTARLMRNIVDAAAEEAQEQAVKRRAPVQGRALLLTAPPQRIMLGSCTQIHTQEVIHMLEAGTKAPEFTLPDKDGREVSLSDFRGKKVVLYFYPKDNTPGCTRQACAFAGAYSQFEALGAVVIGVSRDSAASHQRFAEKNSLPFILLSDPERKAIEAYGVWQEKKNYGKVSMGVVRSTYVIDENGVIEKVMPKVKPDTNAAEILEYLRAEG